MAAISRYRWRISIPIALTLLTLIVSLVFALASRGVTRAAGSEPLVQISHDPFTNSTSQHHTEVEPDTFAFGNTVVVAMQQGRFYNGGASDIGFATSTNGGKTFIHGSLPGITVFSTPPGPYDRASDASVAFDAKHNVWLISSLGLHTAGSPPAVVVADLIVNRSTDGGRTWSKAVVVADGGQFLDKNWTVCDDTASSPFYGHCYSEFDNNTLGDQIMMSTSTDGGKTWGPGKPTANHDFGIGGQPLVQPSGRVIVPIIGFTSSNNQPYKMMSFISTNGGDSWSRTFNISEVDRHVPEGGIRADIPLPSAEIDKSGKVYVVWSDCRFRNGCAGNDIVLTTSTNGINWSAVKGIPIQPGNGADHFIPGLAVDRTTPSASAHLALTYYFYPFQQCQPATCVLSAGFISSTNGGTSWSASETVAAGTFGNVRWLPLTTQGFMVGDYISTSIIPGATYATPAFDVAQPPTGKSPKGSTCIAPQTTCHVATYTTPEGLLAVVGGTNTVGNEQQRYFAPADSSNHKVYSSY